ncbi:lysosome membrane protein 2-like isoform X1 [Asterias amurensis]|uniref:lysosome membrane protein 2-like isoform X1 n=1 Tax=Asterias amurensis TaxID=7602 RepID=UPI003AB3AD78
MGKTTGCFTCLLVVGVVLAVVGAVMFPVVQYLIHSEVVQQTMLENGTMGYDLWQDPPADVSMQFWVWNLTNPAEVKKGKKPFLVQRGPYTYREYMPKQNITPNNNGTVSYVTEKSYVLDLNNSIGDPLKDRFTTINIPLMTFAHKITVMDLPGFLKTLLLDLLRIEDAFPSHTVHEMIWGYPDALVKLAYDNGLAPFPEFGVFVNRNNSNDGVFNVYSGVNQENTDKINHITRWKGQSELSFWSTEESNMINGTDGSYNQPFFDKKKPLYVFSSDICRSIIAVYEKETSVRDMPTWRYVGPPEAFANATAYPPNVGFCTPNASYCLPSGLLNVSNCQFGAPIVMSLPHFLYCDPKEVIDLVNGLTPNKEEHQTFFDVEPMTGGPLNVAKRLQINVVIQPYENIPDISKVAKFFLPIIWLNESAHITVDGANELKSNVETPILLTTIGKWSVLGFGGLLVILSIIVLTALWIQKPQDSQVDNSINDGDISTATPNGNPIGERSQLIP